MQSNTLTDVTKIWRAEPGGGSGFSVTGCRMQGITLPFKKPLTNNLLKTGSPQIRKNFI
jgi:hypothetical protein